MKTYAGRISNKGAQEVKAPYAQGKGVAPKTKEGGDLRSAKSGKGGAKK